MSNENNAENKAEEEQKETENKTTEEKRTPTSEPTENDETGFGRDFPLPKPTLITIATALAQQAMVSMGVLPNPITGKSVFMLNQATHLIDSVELIFDKTAGNRTDEESKILDNIVYELRMLYVAASQEKERRASVKTNETPETK